MGTSGESFLNTEQRRDAATERAEIYKQNADELRDQGKESEAERWDDLAEKERNKAAGMTYYLTEEETEEDEQDDTEEDY